MHISSVKQEQIRDFTAVRWNTYKERLQQWLTLDGECSCVAKTYKHCLDIEFEAIPENAGFHHICYLRFTDTSAITKRERRMVRHQQ